MWRRFSSDMREDNGRTSFSIREAGAALAKIARPLGLRSTAGIVLGFEENAMNSVVARFVDGRVMKGMTADFSPAKDLFHLIVSSAPRGAPPMEVSMKDLKALFFVKDFSGNP